MAYSPVSAYLHLRGFVEVEDESHFADENGKCAGELQVGIYGRQELGTAGKPVK